MCAWKRSGFGVCVCSIASVWTAFTRSILLISSEVTDPFWSSYDSQGTWWWRDWFPHRLVSSVRFVRLVSSVWIRPWSSDTAWFNLCSYVLMIPPIWSDAVWFHPFGLIRVVPILCGLLRAVTSVRFRPCGFDTSIPFIGSYAVTRIFRGVYSGRRTLFAVQCTTYMCPHPINHTLFDGVHCTSYSVQCTAYVQLYNNTFFI